MRCAKAGGQFCQIFAVAAMAFVQRHEERVVIQPVAGLGAEFGEFPWVLRRASAKKCFAAMRRRYHAIEFYCPVIDLSIFDGRVRSDIGIGEPARLAELRQVYQQFIPGKGRGGSCRASFPPDSAQRKNLPQALRAND